MLNRNHALSVFDPFREMEKIEKHFFDEPWGNFSRTFADSFRTDVTDEGDHFKITADLPGFEKENIHLSVDYIALALNCADKPLRAKLLIGFHSGYYADFKLFCKVIPK